MKLGKIDTPALDALLSEVDAHLSTRYPGDRYTGQPSHTVYVDASAAQADTVAEWGARALSIMDAASSTLADLGTPGELDAVRRRLGHAPIMDLRIDFEDGYGYHPNPEEDADAARAGRTLTAVAAQPGVVACGIRFKGLTLTDKDRSLRTLTLLLEAAGGVPPGFVITVPKIRMAEQAHAAVLMCDAVESALDLEAGVLKFELQIESPQAVIATDGSSPVARAIALSENRCTGLHYGTYDYSAACGITSAHQSLEHAVADHAKAVMLAAAAQTGVWVSDGSTQVVPEGDAVDSALRRHHRLVARSLAHGYYQGWDMHPGHLITRWLATTQFFRAALASAGPRLQAYLDRAGGSVVDEPATAQALAASVVRGVFSGTVTTADIAAVAPALTPQVLDDLLARRINPVGHAPDEGVGT